ARPDRSVMLTLYFHQSLECDQHSCKARSENQGFYKMEIVSPIPPPGSRLSNARIGLLMTGLIVVAFALLGIRSIEWFLLKTSLRHRFSKVKWIPTANLADWLADKKRPQPILLDVRTEDEWNVSRLPGSRRVAPNASVDAAAPGIPKETPIVTYCAVGYRSASLATKLVEAGFTSVMNLDGSIFQLA